MSTGGKSKMKIKVKKVLSLSFTFITVILSVIGLVLYYSNSTFDPSKAQAFLPFTVNSNIFLAVVGLVFLVIGFVYLVNDKPLPQWLMQFKLAATTLISITLLTVVFYLAPIWDLTDISVVYYQGCNLFLHVLAPVIAIFGFCLFDVETKIKWRWIWISVVLLIAYIGGYASIVFINEDLGLDIYNFMYEKGTEVISVTRTGVSASVMLVATFALSNIWWALNLASYKCTNKVKAEESAEPVAPVSETKDDVQSLATSKPTAEENKPAESATKSATTQATKPATTQKAKPAAQSANANKTAVKPVPVPVKKAPVKPAITSW